MKYLVSSATLPLAINEQIINYDVLPGLLSKLSVSSCEFVFLPEWLNREPLTKTTVDWKSCQKATVPFLAEFIKNNNIRVDSVHLNRDIGYYLSGNNEMIAAGQDILKENLDAAKVIGADTAVIHLWDTYKEHLDIKSLFWRVREVSDGYPFKITFENIPVSDKTLSNPEIWSLLSGMMPEGYGFTLDLSWASMSGDFDSLIKFKERIDNVHVQGRYDSMRNTLLPRYGNLDILKAVALIKAGYSGHFTLELNAPNNLSDFIQALSLIQQAGS